MIDCTSTYRVEGHEFEPTCVSYFLALAFACKIINKCHLMLPFPPCSKVNAKSADHAMQDSDELLVKGLFEYLIH